MKKLLALMALMTAFFGASFAQETDIALKKLATQFPAEKIYIHYDKEYYVTGETIWFKAYLYSNGMPSTQSSNFYLQLINKDGKVVATRKYPVRGATVNGDILLPDSISQGYYHIRALTPTMMNHHPEFLYTKNVFVFNPKATVTDGMRSKIPGTSSLQFFAESGHLVSDVLTALVFKATDSLGNPMQITGNIKTDDGTLITSFRTHTLGMGKVQFRPQAGKKYIAAVELNGQTAFYPLPEVKTAGVNLKIENEKGGKMFLLGRSKKEKGNEKVRLAAVMNNMTVYENEINFESYFSVKGHLLTDSLPSGILYFTVFDKDGKVLAERLTYVNNGEYASNARIEVIKKGTGPKEENIIEIQFPDLAQRSVSIAVTDEEIVPAPKENIITKLLLTEDLGSHSNLASWYMKDRNDSVSQAAFDNYLVTQPWTRFSWNKLLAGEFPEKKHKDQYLIRVTGGLTDSKTNTPVGAGGLTVFMESEDQVNHNFEIQVDDQGRFTIDSLLIYGKAKLFYAYKTAQGREKAVNISLDPMPMDITVASLPFSLSQKDIAAMDLDPYVAGQLLSKKKAVEESKLAKTKDLDPVVLETKSYKKPIEIVNEKYATGAFTAMGRVNFDNINNPENNRSLSVYDFLKREVNPLIEVNGKFVNTKNFSLFKPSTDDYYKQKQDSMDAASQSPGSSRWIDQGVRERGENYVIDVFINESPTHINFLKTIRMDDVALIKFFEPGFFGSGMNGPGGSVCVYTKKEVVIEEKLDKLDHVTYNGYSLARHFYSPDYSVADLKPMSEDTRTTLYWNPDLYTDDATKLIRLRFFNNDITRKIRIIVEGFDARGRLIHIEKTLPE